MSLDSYYVLECQDSACRFRFPESEAETRGLICPLCSAPAEKVALFRRDVAHNPRSAPHAPVIEALLDNIRSGHNVGSMFRTADAAGIRALHLAGITAPADHPQVAKTALGAERTVSWTHTNNGLEAAMRLKRQGFHLWAVETSTAARSLFEFQPEPQAGPILLIVGNERTGIDPGILLQCDRLFFIPMEGSKRSLNVAVAFGIAVYYLRYMPTPTAAGQAPAPEPKGVK